ncbi:MAG: heme exporter protein CcmD [Methylophagaceae bacterium]
MTEFLYMGGYAFNVWMSYALALLVLSVNIVSPSLRHKRNLLKASDIQQFNETKSDDT